ncbi:MAG TPA: sulfurtransferase [Streptosporangiaceae bacterium]|nr:sulfurtransferase [Streptosporangiaceae bacterium]
MPPSNASPLISVAELADAMASAAAPALLDVRWRLGGPPGIDSYRAGHLPGAVYVDLDTQLAGPPGDGGRHPLPDAAAFEAAMQAAGVRTTATAVVYDEMDATVAARAWWLLRYHGHGQVRVLDGGLRAWTDAGLPVSTTDPRPTPGDFTARPGQLPVLDAAGAAELARSGVLLDARAPARYRGDAEPVDKVAGHIPGALSSPTAANVTADGTFRPADELGARFASFGITAVSDGAAGVAPSGEAAGSSPRVGAYCGSGVVAAHQVLALELAGIPAALYVGSWSGWIADPARPVATGPRPGHPAG